MLVWISSDLQHFFASKFISLVARHYRHNSGEASLLQRLEDHACGYSWISLRYGQNAIPKYNNYPNNTEALSLDLKCCICTWLMISPRQTQSRRSTSRSSPTILRPLDRHTRKKQSKIESASPRCALTLVSTLLTSRACANPV